MTIQQAQLSHGALLLLDQSIKLAQQRNHGYVNTEHLLLAAINEPDSLANKALHNLGVSPDKVRLHIDLLIRTGKPSEEPQTISLTGHGRKTLRLALDEARRQDSVLVEPWHILIGLLREDEGIASHVLQHLGQDQMTVDNLRQQVAQLSHSN